MGTTFSQLYPPAATLTASNLPSQEGKVFIVTGGASGVGLALTSILYGAGATVYIAGRSEVNARSAIKSIESSTHDGASSPGRLEFLFLDLQDLTTIKPAFEAFKSKESKLDVLWNNAAVSLPPLGSKSAQGHELMMATNCLGPFLFTKLLLPLLESTGRASPPGSVRVVWTTSQVVELTPVKGGIIVDELANPSEDKAKNYTITKLGNWYLSNELASRSKNIVSVVQNPGNLKTNLLRHAKWMKWASYPLLYDSKQGAYSELWAGLSSDITAEINGAYVIPWGRLHPSPNKAIIHDMNGVEEGGLGQGKAFWEWCEKETAGFT